MRLREACQRQLSVAAFPRIHLNRTHEDAQPAGTRPRAFFMPVRPSQVSRRSP